MDVEGQEVWRRQFGKLQIKHAIRLDGAGGDVTGTGQVAWSRHARTPYVPSPLLYDGALCFLYHYQGVLSRVAAQTGAEPTGPFRLPEIAEVYSLPVAAAGRLYITYRDGTTLVMSGGEHPRALARNQLDDQFSASAALAGSRRDQTGEIRSNTQTLSQIERAEIHRRVVARFVRAGGRCNRRQVENSVL